ncbi:hypothetical protein PCL_07368 [Purpureocillium lilacinum]|uniref:Carrier domain-containing protein n=1 Tax=Purpureocillium lilacinum TaxID=33203 RepID=A0A2U3DSF0_PURLI|nr:hypothetical protein PCL_07368 [Purpureocillium lilacinum]
MEDQLRHIWANVLSLTPEEIGTDDNLFELGGDSVKAILIMAQAAEIGVYFDVKTLYANPTVAALSKVVGQSGTTPGTEPVSQDRLLRRVRCRVADLGITPASVLNAARMRDDQVDFVHMSARGGIGASPTFIYQVQGQGVEEKLRRAVTVLTLKHPMLRTTFVDVDGEWFQVLLADASPTLEMRSGPIREYASEASTRVITAGDSTAHYALVDDRGTTFFSFSVLHCFFDGFSRTLVEHDLIDVLENPEAFAEQQAECLWYGDLARRLDTGLDDAAAAAFWQRYLEGSQLETIYPCRGELGTVPMRRLDNSLYATLSMDVLQPRGRRFHLATAITTAWALALMHRSGCSDVTFTLLTLGRLYPYEAIDRLVGLLVKDRPFRLQVQDRTRSVESVMTGVQEDLVSAGEYEHGPRWPGKPRVQSYVNIKIGGSTMAPTVVDGLELSPRRDLERWESETQYAVYLEMKPVAEGSCFEMRYHSSLLDDTQAGALLQQFVALLERIGGSSEAGTVADLLDGPSGPGPSSLH